MLYTNNWGPLPGGAPAFTDYGTGLYPWNIVEINACWSAGNAFPVSYDQAAHWFEIDPLYTNYPDYITAFGLGDQDVNGGVFIGWNARYIPETAPLLWGWTPNGEGWTRGFWYFMGEGYTVSQAVGLQNGNPDSTTMAGWASLA